MFSSFGKCDLPKVCDFHRRVARQNLRKVSEKKRDNQQQFRDKNIHFEYQSIKRFQKKHFSGIFFEYII
jgi:hypothetical protein